MLDTLGGRFLKRAVPQDANAVPLSPLEIEAMEEPSRQTLPEANRRVYTSAAMLGLALSVGAYGLLTPRQGDAAVAAEPVSSDSLKKTEPNSDVAVSSVEVPTAAESIAVASSSSQSPTIAHTVQEGQTLWKVAEQYGISVQKLALLNSLQPNATLQVGQVLQVPASAQVMVPRISNAGVKQLPDLKQVPVVAAPVAVASQTMAVPTVQTASKDQPESTLQSLKQNRDRLKQSLAELKSEEKPVAQVIPTVEPQPQGEVQTLVGYQVRPGETLSSIAQNYGVSAAELAKLNQIANPNLLKANQLLQVPQSASQTAQLAQVGVAEAQAAQPTAAQPTAAQPTVEVPVVPSLAATQDPPEPLAIGGDAQQFAFIKPGVSENRSSEVRSNVELRQRPSGQYVNNLVSEIARLRQQYRTQSSGRNRQAVAAAKPVSATSSQRVNPAFKSARQIPALKTESRSFSRVPSQPQTRMDALLANAPKPKKQLVAAANVGSESHTPLLRSSVGKVVSPTLPSLGKPDSYLPSSNKLNGYMWPAKGVLTSGYGWRWGRMHKGIDIAAPVGTPIVAAAAGKVVTSGWNDGGYGNLVEIEHSDGSVTLYAHNSRLLVKVGQQVRQGQQIAEMGSTGFSTGPHSHFEVHLPGRGAVNPIAHLPQSRG